MTPLSPRTKAVIPIGVLLTLVIGAGLWVRDLAITHVQKNEATIAELRQEAADLDRRLIRVEVDAQNRDAQLAEIKGLLLRLNDKLDALAQRPRT